MPYDPAAQAAMANPMGWFVLLLMVAALLIASVAAVSLALALARWTSARPRP